MKLFKTKKYLFLIIIISIFLLCVSSNSFSASFRKGFPAPDFTLKNIDGGTFNLKDYKEKQKLIILYFCSNENKDSVCGIKNLAEYFEEHIIEKKYQVIMIDARKDLKEEDIAQIKEFWTNKKISFSIVLDSQNEVSELYKIEVLPTAILLDKNLVVKRVYPGLISKQQNLMFQYMSYFLGAKSKEVPKKEKKENDGCNGGVCGPPTTKCSNK